MKTGYFLWYLIRLSFLFSLPIVFFSCGQPEKEFKEENKILHAAPSNGGIGALSFELYNDRRYRISNSGGVGEFIYTGTYSLSGNVITFNKLDKSSSVKYNRLQIFRYDDIKDSLFWKYKHPTNNLQTWQEQLKHEAVVKSGSGEIYQVDEINQIAINETHFIIRLDSLKKIK